MAKSRPEAFSEAKYCLGRLQDGREGRPHYGRCLAVPDTFSRKSRRLPPGKVLFPRKTIDYRKTSSIAGVLLVRTLHTTVLRQAFH